MNDPAKLALLRTILVCSESRAAKIDKANTEYAESLRQQLDRIISRDATPEPVVPQPEAEDPSSRS